VIGGAIALYVVAVLTVGVLATRGASNSPEEYFLAGRKLSNVVLFMALFGTNCTAFVLVGIPGRAYHDGIAVFGLNAPIAALGISLTFWAIGSPARTMGRRLGAMTPAELYAKRFGSPLVGYVLFGLFTLYTVPYMVTAVIGAAVTLRGVTDGAVPDWAGGLGVVTVALVYTSLGGMRATAWTNVLQGTLFLAFMVAAFFVLGDSLGGVDAAMTAVADHDPSLLVRGDGKLFTFGGWTSWGLTLSLTVIAFPHMLVRLMAGSSEEALKQVVRLYPIAMIVLWVPAVLIGVWGAAAFPGLEGRASDKIFSLMASSHMPEALAAMGFLAVLAAVMSTLDAQILTLSSMLVRDVLEHIWPTAIKQREVAVGRLFSLVIGAAVYGLAQVWGKSVFEIASVAFSGYVTLTPAMFMGVRWRRFNTAGALASIITGSVVLGLGLAGWMPTLGFLPVFWAWLAAITAGVAVTLATTPADPALAEAAFGT